VFNSEAYRHFEMLCGYNDLKKTVADIGPTHEFTKLKPVLEGVDPDDAFSKIPYEKGSLFLYYLERKVGGAAAMKEWLKSYFSHFKTNSLTTADMKAHFLEHFAKKTTPEPVSSIEWDHWLSAPGLPNFDPNAVLDRSLSANCSELAKRWKEDGGKSATPDDLKQFRSKQTMFFLDELINNATPLPGDVLDRLDAHYKLSEAGNVEIAFRWLMLCLKSRHLKVMDQVGLFASRHGRGLYIRPLYKTLHEVDHASAVKFYHANRGYYHSVIRNMFDKILEWKEQI
jgi:leukotriene-A4 hydrolase